MSATRGAPASDPAPGASAAQRRSNPNAVAALAAHAAVGSCTGCPAGAAAAAAAATLDDDMAFVHAAAVAVAALVAMVVIMAATTAYLYG